MIDLTHVDIEQCTRESAANTGGLSQHCMSRQSARRFVLQKAFTSSCILTLVERDKLIELTFSDGLCGADVATLAYMCIRLDGIIYRLSEINTVDIEEPNWGRGEPVMTSRVQVVFQGTPV